MSTSNLTMTSDKKIHHRGKLLQNEPLSKHCSWRTGGYAEYFFQPLDLDDLIAVLGQFSECKITWLGLGSNVLIRDGGLDGLVISTAKSLNNLVWLENGLLRVDCGVACAKVAKESVRKGYVGAEFLAGIPGTIGGALAMNAGAFAGETWDLVAHAQVLNRAGELSAVEPGDYVTGYRHVGLPEGQWFVSADLAFEDLQASEHKSEQVSGSDIGTGDAVAGGANDGQARIKALLAQRASTQPIGVASCGSVFKNPQDEFAGRLIEQAGLKGFRLGRCAVSDKHANFIVNDSNATATEIESLIKHVQSQVLQQFGIFLEPEVRIIGNAPTEVRQ